MTDIQPSDWIAEKRALFERVSTLAPGLQMIVTGLEFSIGVSADGFNDQIVFARPAKFSRVLKDAFNKPLQRQPKIDLSYEQLVKVIEGWKQKKKAELRLG